MSPSQSAKNAYAQAATICACNSLRRASRAVTQLFDQTLEPSGLRSTQLVILLEIAAAGSTTVPELARRLVVDRSTMQRNLQPLLHRGHLRAAPGEARRSRGLTVTPQGLRAIETAVPLWKRAQSSFVAQFGAGRWQALREDLSDAVTAARSDVAEPWSVSPPRRRTGASRRTRKHPRGRSARS